MKDFVLDRMQRWVIRRRVGDLHAALTDDDMLAAIGATLHKVLSPEVLQAVTKFALKCHDANRREYTQVMRGIR